jgi:hypothetical protein
MANQNKRLRVFCSWRRKIQSQLSNAHFAHNFTRSHRAEYPFMPGDIHFSMVHGAKAVTLVGLLLLICTCGPCSVLLPPQTTNIKASSGFCQLPKTNFPISHESVYLWKVKNLNWFMHWNQKLCPCGTKPADRPKPGLKTTIPSTWSSLKCRGEF